MQERRESIICPGCGCLCDDLDVILAGDRIVEVANVCLWGVSRFLDAPRLHPKKERRRLREPQVRRRDRWETVPYAAALEEAGEILSRARRPVIYGLSNCGCRAQEAALQLARRRRARLEPGDLAFMAPYYETLRQHRLFWASLEVIRDEAETILFWGANPIHANPRQVVRYAVFARGRFTERGVEERQVAAVDLYRTELGKFCHLFVRVEPARELDLVRGVTDILRGQAAIEPRVRGTKRLADFLGRASYGVMFCARGVGYHQGSQLWRRLAELTAVLNTRARFVMFPLSGDFNATGLYHLLLNELGHPGAPDFVSPTSPVSQTQPVDFREVDAVLVAGADLLWSLAEEQVQDLVHRRVPLVVLSPFANRTTAQAQVVLPVALAGVETTEVAYRMDGLPVVLRQLRPGALPPDYEVLAALQ